MHYRNGFSFAEVMFAVVILGIGFIMVAAVFPVAVEQTRATGDEAAASELARDVMRSISSTAKAADFDHNNDGVTQSFASNAALWPQVSGQLISPADPRYACVPFFCTNADGTVRITVLVIRRWLHDSYTSADLAGDGDLSPRPIAFNSISPQPGGTDVIAISKINDTLGNYRSIAPGSFIIVSSFGEGGTTSGQMFKVAAKQSEDSDSQIWTLAPGFGLQPGESHCSGTAAVIGSDLADPSAGADSDNTFAGPAQDISVYTTFITPR